jgi:hypothetical protein
MYSVMLARLEAEQELREYQVACAAGGLQMEEHARARYISALERKAQGQRQAKEASADDLAAMGISVVKEDS